VAPKVVEAALATVAPNEVVALLVVAEIEAEVLEVKAANVLAALAVVAPKVVEELEAPPDSEPDDATVGTVYTIPTGVKGEPAGQLL